MWGHGEWDFSFLTGLDEIAVNLGGVNRISIFGDEHMAGSISQVINQENPKPIWGRWVDLGVSRKERNYGKSLK